MTLDLHCAEKRSKTFGTLPQACWLLYQLMLLLYWKIPGVRSMSLQGLQQTSVRQTWVAEKEVPILTGHTSPPCTLP